MKKLGPFLITLVMSSSALAGSLFCQMTANLNHSLVGSFATVSTFACTERAETRRHFNLEIYQAGAGVPMAIRYVNLNCNSENLAGTYYGGDTSLALFIGSTLGVFAGPRGICGLTGADVIPAGADLAGARMDITEVKSTK